jgi:hypothetical protein
MDWLNGEDCRNGCQGPYVMDMSQASQSTRCSKVMLAIVFCCCMQVMMLTMGLTLSRPPVQEQRMTLQQLQKLEHVPKQGNQGKLGQAAVPQPTAR